MDGLGAGGVTRDRATKRLTAREGALGCGVAVKIMQKLAALTATVLLTSCAMWRAPVPLPPPVLPSAPAAAPAPEEVVAPRAEGDVRITITAAKGLPAFRIVDDGERVGSVEGGGRLQWDRPAGVVPLQADPVSNGMPGAGYLGLFLPGEREIALGMTAEGGVAFEKATTVRLADARRIARLRQRVQRVPRDTAVDLLNSRLFAAPAPVVMRSVYADADQRIAVGANGPALAWTRYEAPAGQWRRSPGKAVRPRRMSLEHPFAQFVDADIALGAVTRVELRRNARDTMPVQVCFRIMGDEPPAARLESLLAALLVCCPNI
jgi:hypothetical protein